MGVITGRSTGMRRRLFWIAVLLVPVIAFVGRSLGYRFGSQALIVPRSSEYHQVIGYYPYWDRERGLSSIRTYNRLMTEVSPFWYTLDASGEIVLFEQGGYEDPELVASLQAKGLNVTPSLANLNAQGWDPVTVSQLINDPEAAARHISSIVNLVVSKHYDGIDLDYEQLNDGDRDAFSRFVKDLASALHAEGKTLSVTVHPKTSDTGFPNGPTAQDWSRIGQVADQVRIMVYDYHWATSSPGPIAPINWVKQVAAYAVTTIPGDKIILGFGLYGYDWGADRADTLVWEDLMWLAGQYGSSVNWDEASMSPWFEYTDSNGIQHNVWFENNESISAKLDIVNEYGVGGVHFWHLGGEDPQVWEVVQAKLAIQPRYASHIPAIFDGRPPYPAPQQ